jgi:outer membrane protein assembly factor BamB
MAASNINAGLLDCDWPSVGRDASNSNALPENCGLAGKDNSVLWKATLKSAVITKPLISQDYLIVGTSDNTLTALHRVNGKVLWTAKTAKKIANNPFCEGNKVFASFGDSVASYDTANGSLLWNAKTDFEITSQIVGYNGKILFPTKDKTFKCLSASDGKELWSYFSGELITGMPAISDDTVFIAGRKLIALTLEKGKKLWELTLDEANTATVMAFDKRVYVKLDKTIYAIETDTGNPRWKYSAQKKSLSPSILNKKLYFVSEDFQLYCLDANFFGKACCISTGKRLWGYTNSTLFHQTPIPCGDFLYAISADNRVMCIDNEKGNLLWDYKPGQFLDNAVICGKCLYVAEDNSITAYTKTADLLKFKQGKQNYFRDEYEMLMDSAPVTIKNKAFIPAKFAIEPFGGTIAWTQSTKTVKCTLNGNTLQMTVGSNQAKLGAKTVQIDSDKSIVPIIQNGRVLVPMRFLCEGLGLTVGYEQKTSEILISRR